MKAYGIKLFIIILLFGLLIATVSAEEVHRPYALAGEYEGSVSDMLVQIKEKLAESEFEIVGEYFVYKNAAVVVVTSESLKEAASQTDFGGYGAAQRISLTKPEEKIQLSYTNPVYWGNAYKMKPLTGIYEALKNTLGFEKEFGSEDGLTIEDLKEYHYMFAMPFFEDHNLLAEYPDYETAVAAVEKGLRGGKLGGTKVYRIDIPNKDETVFGVAIKTGDGADLTVLGNCDITDTYHTAYVPYELLVSGNKIFAPHGRFRIALSFPDLSMGTFMQISGAPGDIEDVLTAVAGGE